MDVYCAKCREPWEFHHLRYDAMEDADFYRLGLNRDKVDNWDGNLESSVGQVTARVALQNAGYTFGSNVSLLLTCPGCKYHEENGHIKADKSKEREELYAMLGDLMGDDADGCASMMDSLEAHGL